MKKKSKTTTLFFSLILFFSLTTCDILENDDPCDDTAFKISGNAGFHVSAWWKDAATNMPIDDSSLEARIEFHKIACGSDEYKPGGDFTFTGFTDEDAQFWSGQVNYNIRNSKDRIILIISYHKNDGTWQQVEYEEFTYSEDDFNGGFHNVALGYANEIVR